MLLTLSSACAAADRVTSIVDAVISKAKARTHFALVLEVVPGDLNVAEYREIARRLMLDRNDLEQLGDDGVNYKEAAIDYALIRLSRLPDGGQEIVAIADDPTILVDGARSLSLCDAAVHRGREMIPLLEGMKVRKEWGVVCAGNIRAGRKSAF